MQNPEPEILLPGASGDVSVPVMQSSGMDPSADIYNRLLRNRIVYLGSEVNDQVANFLTAQLLFLEGEDPEKDIWLYINSPGGSVTAGMAIYDTMQFVSPDVGTICMGLGASMGQFLLCAGAPGKRYALPHARIMMHQPSAGMAGQASDIAIQAEQLKYIKDLLADRIATHTGQTKEQINTDSDRDRWFTAEQAKEYGIIDTVLSYRKLSAQKA
jgi:ATP-dependent Clp protease protease subunit